MGSRRIKAPLNAALQPTLMVQGEVKKGRRVAWVGSFVIHLCLIGQIGGGGVSAVGHRGGGSSPSGASQRRVFSDGSRARRAVIPTVLGRTGSCGRVAGPDEMRIYLVLFLKRGSGACSSNISAAGWRRCHTRQVPGPARLLRLCRFCLGTCLSH